MRRKGWPPFSHRRNFNLPRFCGGVWIHVNVVHRPNETEVSDGGGDGGWNA